MLNSEIAGVLERIADMMEIDGADGFRINAYRRAARSIKDCVEDVAVLAEEKRLTELAGVGKGTAERIVSYLQTGHIEVLDQLTAKLPEGLPHLLEIQGMGPKKVAQVHKELGVGNIDDLKRVIVSGELEKLDGLGPTSVKKIKEGIAFVETSGDRTPLGIALPIAEHFADRVDARASTSTTPIPASARLPSRIDAHTTARR